VAAAEGEQLMRAWLSLALPTIVALQALAFGGDPARAASKVSFGQVSATATMWPGVIAAKTKDTYPRDGRMDLDVFRAMIDVMVEGEELPAKPQGDVRRYLDETMLAK
jgi:hypothetical protein